MGNENTVTVSCLSFPIPHSPFPIPHWGNSPFDISRLIRRPIMVAWIKSKFRCSCQENEDGQSEQHAVDQYSTSWRHCRDNAVVGSGEDAGKLDGASGPDGAGPPPRRPAGRTGFRLEQSRLRRLGVSVVFAALSQARQ